jgi:hypothetical protein
LEPETLPEKLRIDKNLKMVEDRKLRRASISKK